MSTCNQSASCSIVVLHAFPRAPKSADSIDGAMIAGGDMAEARTKGTRTATLETTA